MRVLTVILIFLLLAPIPALAADTDEVEQALPPSAREILGDATVRGAAGGGVLLAELLRAEGWLER